jgi:LacI family transcriptional regulator
MKDFPPLFPENKPAVPVSPSEREIVVLIDTEDTWGRRVIAGIANTVREQYRWRLLVAPRDDQWRLRVPAGWRGDGLITAMRDDLTAEHVRKVNLPTVNVSSWGVRLRWCARVVTDDRERAVLAWEHFRNQGYERFGYYAPPSQRYSPNRGNEFVSVIRQAGYPCEVFGDQSESNGPPVTDPAQWLKSLKYPIAIFAADPHPALQLTEICRKIGVRVPQDIAILAGDTDDLLCEIADPPISSIELACEQIGAIAVEQLESLMSGPILPVSLIKVPPVRVKERRSTAVLAIGDPLFTWAVQFIRSEAHTGINVSDVLQAVPISRRMLEQRFAAVLGSSPAAEIRRVRIEKVKELLATTDLTISEISRAAGFSNPSQLSSVFRSMMGVTPIEFRENLRRPPIQRD